LQHRDQRILEGGKKTKGENMEACRAKRGGKEQKQKPRDWEGPEVFLEVETEKY